MEEVLIAEFKGQIVFRLNECLPRILQCLDELTEDQLWQKPNDVLNSVGNLVLHLCGNIRQYAISSLGRQPDVRQRATEFDTEGGIKRSELAAMLTDTVSEAFETIQSVAIEEWLRSRKVQGFELTGIGIMIHVAEHFSYHTGQIAFWTKYLQKRDLGFYADADLGQVNEG